MGDSKNQWGISALHIVAMSIHSSRKDIESSVRNYVSLIDYGFNPLLHNYFCRGANALTCLIQTAPKQYDFLRNYVAKYTARRAQALEAIQQTRPEFFSGICGLIMDL